MLVEKTYTYTRTAEINIVAADSWEATWAALQGTAHSTPLTLVTTNSLTGAGKYDIARCALLFDTSDHTPSAGILSAKLKLLTLSSFARSIADGDFYLVVQNGQPVYPHDPPVNSDFYKDNYAGNGGQVLINAAIGTLQDLFINLNATGQGWITKGGTTKFLLRSSKDIDGVKPTVGLNYIRVYSYRMINGWYRASLIVEWDIVIPTVTTDPATAVGTTSATLNGTLGNDGGEVCACGFEWGETIAYEHGATPTDSKTTGQTFSQVISGLTPSTTYHFRAFATNSIGTSYGIDRTFTTDALPPIVIIPTVTTNPATLISQVSATLNGILDDDGGEACDCSFEWGIDISYGTTTPTQSKVTGESFPEIIGGLFADITYHFRAFATNSAGTAYGADRTFTTPGNPMSINKSYALDREEK